MASTDPNTPSESSNVVLLVDSDYEAEDYPVPDDLESYVYSPAFDEECAIEFRKARAGASHSYVSNPESADALWSPVAPTTSSLSSVGSSPHDPSPLEAKYYYFGISSSGRGSVGGPRLLFRTSKDRWVPPTGPDTYPRTMRLCDVPEDHQLAKNPSLWDPIRNQVVELLKNGNIQFSTVTLVCFTWLEKKEKDDDEENEEEEEEKDNDNDNEKKENDDDGEQDDLEAEFDRMPLVKAVEEGERYTTPPTIWVGVLPNTLSGTTANDLATEILGIVSQYNLTSVEVAFCESEAQLLSGSTLFTPVDDDDDHKEVIDNLSTALPLSIAGKKTSMQGTLTCFFRVGKELYAITARHNLFNNGKDDEEYTYVDSAPKKQVIVMGPDTFNNYLAFIQAKISNLNNTVAYLVVRDDRLKQEVAEDLNNNEPAGKLEKTVEQLAGLRARISMLKAFYVNVARRWSKVNDRVIGYVAWAPKIDVSVPHSYTRDFCVIHLDKKKFKDGFLGNVLSLGPDITPADFTRLMYGRDDVPSEFKYPQRGLATVEGILTAAEINEPNSKDLVGDPIRRVIKCGMTTKATVGTLTKFKAHVRRYLSSGIPRDSVEVTILPHLDLPRPFSRGGDSGALIIDALFKYVVLLTGGCGMGNADLSDITYGTLFEWIWEIIKAKFPGADLYFGDIVEFFKDEA